MDYDALIRNWHSLASEEDYFSRFTFEYMAFMGYLKKKKYIDKSKEREAIQKLKVEDDLKKRYLIQISINSNLAKHLRELKEELDRKPLSNEFGNSTEELKWWNCSHTDLNQMTAPEKAKPKGVLQSTDDWENIVEFWCSIRNNLFHSAKDPQNDRDKKLVEFAYKTLSPFVGILVT